MPTLRRILKYTPAVVLGLLVAAWGASLFCAFGYKRVSINRPNDSVGVVRGNLVVMAHHHPGTPGTGPDGFYCVPLAKWPGASSFGRLNWHSSEIPGQWGTLRGLRLETPLLVVVSALLPLAIGPLLSFRFSLWHYLAFTALVALELSYYLQWQ